MLFLNESLKLKNNYRLSILSDDELVITKDGYNRLKNEVERLKKF